MGNLKANDLRAIKWFCDKNDLKPALSLVPYQMNFTDKKTGLDKTCHLDYINLSYKEMKNEEAALKKKQAKEK